MENEAKETLAKAAEVADDKVLPKAETEKQTKAPKRFGKEKLLKSKHFTKQEKYFLQVILDNAKQYTLEEAKQVLAKELRRKVN